MALFEDLFKGKATTGIAIGLGAAILTPVVISVLGGAARPLARAAVKSGIIVYEKGKETLAEFGEVMDDLVAEARAELEKGQAQGAAITGSVAGADAAAQKPDEA